MIQKSMPSGYDPMDEYRFSEKIMLEQTDRAGSRFEEKSSRSNALSALSDVQEACFLPLAPC
jgi:hypothetical protein